MKKYGLIAALTLVALKTSVIFADTKNSTAIDGRAVTSNAQLHKGIPAYSEEVIRRVWISKKIRALVNRARKEPGDGETPLVRGIYNSDTLESYCEMVQLVAWFNDTSASETVTNNITKRGMKMLPILEYALKHPNVRLDKKGEDLRLDIIRGCISAIKKGEVIGYDE